MITFCNGTERWLITWNSVIGLERKIKAERGGARVDGSCLVRTNGTHAGKNPAERRQTSVDLQHGTAAGITHPDYVTLCWLAACCSWCGDSRPHTHARTHAHTHTHLSLPVPCVFAFEETHGWLRSTWHVGLCFHLRDRGWAGDGCRFDGLIIAVETEVVWERERASGGGLYVHVLAALISLYRSLAWVQMAPRSHKAY